MGTLSTDSTSAGQAVLQPSGIPAYVSRFNRSKPVIAVIAENSATELTDYVVPYGVLSASGAAQVWAIATQAGAIRMLPALQLEPQATVAEFDAQFPEGADYVVVPAVVRQKDPALLGWINKQAEKGATIVGICDGVWVLAYAGLLEGRKGVGHWFSFNRLAKKFPQTEWLRNVRYVANGNIITTTGVTASIPVSVALVEAIAGRDRATSLAQSLGIQRWDAGHQSDHFKLKAKHILTALTNVLSVWARKDIGIPVQPGIDEIALALVADAYSRTFRSKAFSLAAAAGPVTTKRDLVVLPDRVEKVGKAVNQTVALASDQSPVSLFDDTLRAIEQSYGSDTADFIALQLEYPR